MGILLFVVLSLLTFLILYLVHSSNQSAHYFKKRKVFYMGGGLSRLLSLFYNLIWNKKTLVDLLKNQHDKLTTAGVKIGGAVNFGVISYFVIDLEILKHIFIKDFDHFVNRRGRAFPDDIAKKMLIFLNGDQWKQLRSKMSPTFTTSKIKRMFEFFDESSEKLVKYVQERMQESAEGEIDLGEGFSKLTMDTIASAVCGMDSQAFDQVGPSIFERMGQKLQILFSPAKFMQFVLARGFPNLATKMGIRVFDRDMAEFFSGAIKSSIRHRQKTGEKGNDFIQLMLEARAGQLRLEEESELDAFEKDAVINTTEGGTKGSSTMTSMSTSTSTSELLDDDGIISNCVLFILAGFDTTQSLLLFCAYALALHQDVQEKLREEIETCLAENDGKFTYEGIHKMVYLDMVINETLRFYPPAPVTDRSCTKEYKIPGTDIEMKKGEAILVPIIGIHHDERYYPEPEKFEPERFSAQNKSKIPPYAFLPFGHGPRNCIGMRFALTEVKLAIAHLVHNFVIEPSQKTLIPMQYQSGASLKPKSGMWLALKKRSETKITQ